MLAYIHLFIIGSISKWI